MTAQNVYLKLGTARMFTFSIRRAYMFTLSYIGPNDYFELRAAQCLL